MCIGKVRSEPDGNVMVRTGQERNGEAGTCGRKEMNCPSCDNDYTKVKETRLVEDYPRWIKRRRVCLKCDTQFWSVELPMEDLATLQEEDREL